MKALSELAEQEVRSRNDVQQMQNKSIETLQGQLDRLLDMATRDLVSADEYMAKSDALKAALSDRQHEQAATADRVKNWYEIVGKALDTLTNAQEKFANGDLRDKRNILATIGQNPVLLNGKLEITPNEWLIPIKNSAKITNTRIDEVRTMPDKIKKDAEASIYQSWLGWRDSNPRMPGPKPGALPLGDIPMVCQQIDFNLFGALFQMSAGCIASRSVYSACKTA